MSQQIELIDRLRGGLIASAQAYPGEPMRDSHTMAHVAQSCEAGGAVAIRAQGIADCALFHERLSVPVIGLWKDDIPDSPVFITPTLRHALVVAATGVEIIALDGTRRARPDGLSLAETMQQIKSFYPEVLIMADCGSLEDALAAEEAGADLLGTTLAGYTGEREKTSGPDYELVTDVVNRVDTPVIAEGRIHTPEAAARMLRLGAHAVCVGTAITHPRSITGWFVAALAAQAAPAEQAEDVL